MANSPARAAGLPAFDVLIARSGDAARSKPRKHERNRQARLAYLGMAHAQGLRGRPPLISKMQNCSARDCDDWKSGGGAGHPQSLEALGARTLRV